MVPPTSGMILLNKTSGLTSFQALGATKRYFGTKKVGHAGTLDKFAEGLLLIFVNSATRLVPYFVGLDKTYEALIRFGLETDTLDPCGTVVRTGPIPALDQISQILPQFLGTQQQVPPSYSAIHINGRRAYERVLAGEELELKARTVEISELTILNWDAPDLRIRVSCGSGTYVRSIARDLGMALGSAAYLQELVRTRIGPFHLSDSVLTDDLSNSDPGTILLRTGLNLVRSMDGLNILNLRSEYRLAFFQGKGINNEWFFQAPKTAEGTQESQEYAVILDNEFLGIAEQNNGSWKYRVVFPSPSY